MSADGKRTGTSTCGCKVGDAIDAYDLAGLNADLRTEWTGKADERRSVRELAEGLNQAVLRTAMDSEGMSVLEGEVENLYRLLTEEQGGDARTRARRRLEREGVDADAVTDDFVSHQTMYRHLTNCLEATASTDEEDDDTRRERTSDHLRSLQQRVVAVAENTLSSLRSNDALALADFEVFVDVSVICSDCGRDYDIGTLLSRGGCVCQQEE